MFTKKISKEQNLDLSNLKTKFKYETKYLSEYLSFTSELTEKKNQQLSDQMFEDSQADPESESLIQQLFEKEKDALLSYYHHSAIVLVYTIFESTMADLCNEVKTFIKADFSHNCLTGGNLIEKSKTYLQLTSGLPFDLIEGEWGRIGQFQKLRNMIVHQNSCFTGKSTSIEKQKKQIENNFHSIKISDDYEKFYILDDKLIHEFICLIKDFVVKVMNYLESVVFLVEDTKTEATIENVPF